MEKDKLQNEREHLQRQVKELRSQLIQQIERNKLYGLDHKIKQVQRQFQLMERV